MLDSIIGPVEIEYMLDLSLAVALGFAIGAERESRGKDAGISTHTLVIVGAMLFTFMSMTVDPASKSRIAAQIVSGIGFLGAPHHQGRCERQEFDDCREPLVCRRDRDGDRVRLFGYRYGIDPGDADHPPHPSSA